MHDNTFMLNLYAIAIIVSYLIAYFADKYDWKLPKIF